MDSISDLLVSKNMDEPPEVAIVKKFLKDYFQATCQIDIRPRQIVIIVGNAPLAGALRMRLHELQTACRTDKKLMIRIS